MISLEEMKKFKIEEDKSIHDDETKKRLIDDDFMMDTKICKSPNHKDCNHFNHLFSHRPGETRMLNRIKPVKKDINFQKKINKLIKF